ncbi:MAG: peptide-methionine (S)-S-oxide reductase MsrA [Gammaproteobacteria bacterium AqS3]|nr:peptide-methionine (S)-S-oxide reductase MsrA [Gammaproteobacteria bacterium AqS3]
MFLSARRSPRTASRSRAALWLLICLGALCTAAPVQTPAQNISVSVHTPPSDKHRTAIFAGGCFWCMEEPFDRLRGVISTRVGYIGGSTVDPTYKQITTGRTGHAEAVEITYDPDRVDYGQLLAVFWRQIDPTDPGGQFVDRGSQYRTAIFYIDAEQQRLAEASRDAMKASGRFGPARLVTEIVEAGTFYPAEDYHQDYYKKSSSRYKYYRFHSGRDRYLDRIWSDER